MTPRKQTPEADAVEPEPMAVTLSINASLELDNDRRTISGLILPYNVLAQRTSAGVMRFAAGSLKHHPAVERVKLLIDHDQSRAVGYAVNIEQRENGVWATFSVPEGPEGDEALAKAANGIRDGLSIGAQPTMRHKSPDGVVTEVTEAILDEVSLVALPAFTDARTFTVRASQEPVQAEAVTFHTTALGQDVVRQDQAADGAAAPLAPAPYVTAQRAATRETVTATLATTLRTGGTASSVMAALADIVPANDAAGAYLGNGASPGGADWLGELWTADNTPTPITDALARKPLTSLKVDGWRWDVKPQVGPYTGNKAEIPTNSPKTVPAQTTAERFAGGWDIDRAYIDLGDQGMLNSLFDAAVADSRRELEEKVSAKLIAGATAVEASTSLTAALGKLGAVAGQLGSQLNVIAMASDVWSVFTNLSADEVPWWLRNQGDINLGTQSGSAGGLSFTVNPTLAAGSVLALDRRAATLHVPSPNPVKVQALDLARGGVDLGVYGYFAVMIHDARAILSTTVTAAV